MLKGAAWVIPRGSLQSLTTPVEQSKIRGSLKIPPLGPNPERLAMEAVMAYERTLGNVPRDVSAEKKGWDIESRDTREGHLRFIEVKGRQADAAR